MSDKFVLISDTVLDNAIACIQSKPLDGSWQITVTEVKADKTKKQLAALFGLWVKYLAEKDGESEQVIHKQLKNWFLARIYITEPMSEEQEQWVELMAFYSGTIKLEKHSERISLGWANRDQTVEYMKAIEQHFQAIGEPLPIPDKYWKHFR